MRAAMLVLGAHLCAVVMTLEAGPDLVVNGDGHESQLGFRHRAGLEQRRRVLPRRGKLKLYARETAIATRPHEHRTPPRGDAGQRPPH